MTIRYLPCSWKYPECSFSRICSSLSLSLQLLISFALAGKSPPDQGTDCSSPPQPCYMNMSGQNIQPPAVFRLQHRSSTVLIILVMTAFNITYLGGNYRCLCFLTNLCPFAGTLRYMVYLVLIANTGVNPVLYSFFKSDIQKELFKLFSR